MKHPSFKDGKISYFGLGDFKVKSANYIFNIANAKDIEDLRSKTAVFLEHLVNGIPLGLSDIENILKNVTERGISVIVKMHTIPRDQLEKYIKTEGLKRQINHLVKYEIRDTRVFNELEIRKILEYNIPSVFHEIVTNEVNAAIKTGAISVISIIDRLESKIDQIIEQITESWEQDKDTIINSIYKNIENGYLSETKIRLEYTISYLQEARERLVESLTGLEETLKNLKDDIISDENRLKGELKKIFWGKVDEVFERLISLLRKYEETYRNLKVSTAKIKWIDELLDSLMEILGKIVDFLGAVEDLMRKNVRIRDPHIQISNEDLEDLVKEIELVLNFEEFKERWEEAVKEEIEMKIRESIVANLRLLNPEGIEERWASVDKAISKIRLKIAVIPDFVSNERIKGSEHFDYIIKEPHWRITTYKFVFNVRAIEFAQYLKEEQL